MTKDTIILDRTVPILDKLERVEALNYVTDRLNTMLEYGELPSDIKITNISLFGSRITGNCTEESDLDVRVEYMNTGDTYHKESHIFNMLYDDEAFFNGIKLDFFPVLIENE